MKASSIPLLPFALVMSAITGLRNWAYDVGLLRIEGIDKPVISIGNITVGGTGKTPMAEFLLAELRSMGIQTAYLSRGYGRKTKGYNFVDPANGGAETFGDEAYQVASKFPDVPVAVCERRIDGARRLMESHAFDVLVLDDAFQHRGIRRDLDWVMVDTTCMPSRDWPLPAGRLRESLSGLRRAQTLILSKFSDTAMCETACKELQERFPQQAIAAFALQPAEILPFNPIASYLRQTVSSLKGRSVILFSGIGNPRHFRDTVIRAGADVCAELIWSDHHRYTAADLEKILAVFESKKEIKGKLRPALILTTEKDYFRLKAMPWMQRFVQLPFAYMTVGMVPVMGWDAMAVEIKKLVK